MSQQDPPHWIPDRPTPHGPPEKTLHAGPSGSHAAARRDRRWWLLLLLAVVVLLVAVTCRAAQDAQTAAPPTVPVTPSPEAPISVITAPAAPAPLIGAPVEVEVDVNRPPTTPRRAVAERVATTKPTTAARGTSRHAAASGYYSSCADAKRAGAAPIRRGEPGYRSGLDRDGDGTACDR